MEIKQWIKKPKTFLSVLLYVFGRKLTDKIYLNFLYRLRVGGGINFDHPLTFAQKCQWLKLYDRKDFYHQMVDKAEMKTYAASIIGSEYIVPTYAVWESVDDINVDELPESFMIKPTHTGGSSFIFPCRSKENFDVVKMKTALKKSLSINIYKSSREWTYKGVKPRIIAEKLLEDSKRPYPQDYKIWCFNGEPKMIEVVANRGVEAKVSDYFFDIKGNYLPIQHKGYPNNPDVLPDLPINLELMIDLARKLSNGFPHLRVDFYEVNNKTYLGELTFAEQSGFAQFYPDKWNYILGDWINLSKR